jgi:hypothetical protein
MKWAIVSPHCRLGYCRFIDAATSVILGKDEKITVRAASYLINVFD